MGKGIGTSLLWGALLSLVVPVLLRAEDGHFRAVPSSLETRLVRQADGLASAALDLVAGWAEPLGRPGAPEL